MKLDRSGLWRCLWVAPEWSNDGPRSNAAVSRQRTTRLELRLFYWPIANEETGSFRRFERTGLPSTQKDDQPDERHHQSNRVAPQLESSRILESWRWYG